MTNREKFEKETHRTSMHLYDLWMWRDYWKSYSEWLEKIVNGHQDNEGNERC